MEIFRAWQRLRDLGGKGGVPGNLTDGLVFTPVIAETILRTSRIKTTANIVNLTFDLILSLFISITSPYSLRTFVRVNIIAEHLFAVKRYFKFF